MKRRMISAALCLVLMSGLLTVSVSGETTEAAYRMAPLLEKLAGMSAEEVDASVNRYKDMKAHWSRKEVGKLAGLGIISVDGVDTFNPDKPLQADHFIKMMVCAMGFKPGEGKPYWAQTYIDVAVSEGLIKAGEFPNYTKPITREQMAKILIRAAMLVDTAPGAQYDQYVIGKIKDYSAIADECKQSVIDTYKMGLMQGSDGKFLPKTSLTRAEGSTVVIRFIDKNARTPVLPGPDEIVKLPDNRYNPTEIYPGSIPETFPVVKAAQDAIPKAKGYVDFFYNPNNKMVFAWLYKDKASHDQSVLNLIGDFEIAYSSNETYAYCLYINDEAAYNQLFAGYMHEVFKTIFGKDADKAIALHDMYMNMEYTRTDGDNQYQVVTLNNRHTAYLKYPNSTMGIQIKFIGVK